MKMGETFGHTVDLLMLNQNDKVEVSLLTVMKSIICIVLHRKSLQLTIFPLLYNSSGWNLRWLSSESLWLSVTDTDLHHGCTWFWTRFHQAWIRINLIKETVLEEGPVTFIGLGLSCTLIVPVCKIIVWDRLFGSSCEHYNMSPDPVMLKGTFMDIILVILR